MELFEQGDYKIIVTGYRYALAVVSDKYGFHHTIPYTTLIRWAMEMGGQWHSLSQGDCKIMVSGYGDAIAVVSDKYGFHHTIPYTTLIRWVKEGKSLT